MANQLLIEIYAFFITYAKIWIVGNVVESGAHSFLRVAGKPVAVHAQCKSTEYYFYHRPSITVENIISPTTFDKIKKMRFVWAIETFSIRSTSFGGGRGGGSQDAVATINNSHQPWRRMHECAPWWHARTCPTPSFIYIDFLNSYWKITLNAVGEPVKYPTRFLVSPKQVNSKHIVGGNGNALWMHCGRRTDYNACNINFQFG